MIIFSMPATLADVKTGVNEVANQIRVCLADSLDAAEESARRIKITKKRARNAEDGNPDDGTLGLGAQEDILSLLEDIVKRSRTGSEAEANQETSS
jgi:hypothetical protein